MGKKSKNTEIRHKGVIRNVTEVSYWVSVERAAACQNCTAKKICNLSEDDNELLEIKKYPHQNYNINDEVVILLNETLGWKAVLYGYVLPCIILLLGIIIPVFLGMPQGWAGLTGIGITALYYIGLAGFRKRLDRKFIFRIE